MKFYGTKEIRNVGIAGSPSHVQTSLVSGDVIDVGR